MAQDATQRWNRTEGVLVAPGSTPDDVAARLRERAVVARLEWYPASAHLLSITLLSDAEGRVAVTPPSRGGVVPGMGVSELAEGLARELGADATIGPASFDALPEDVELPEVSTGPSPMSRTVVVSPLSAYMVPLQATLLERPLAVASAPGIDRRIVMYSGEGAELGAFGWDDESLPAIIFRVDERDMTVRAVLTGESEDDAVYSWSMTSRYVWGGVEEPGPALSALVNEMLTDSTDASLIARAVPDADVEAATAALAVEGVEGLAQMLAALGLPAWVESVLTGRLAPVEVPGVVVHEPRGLSNAVGRSVGLMLADPSVPGSAFWQSYVRAVTETPWLVRAGAALEAGLGGYSIEHGFDPAEKQTVQDHVDADDLRDATTPESVTSSQDAGARGNGWVTLHQHLADTREQAEALAKVLRPAGIDDAHLHAAAVAGVLHDLGKAHHDWAQALLDANGDTPPDDPEQLYAKSPGTAPLQVLRQLTTSGQEAGQSKQRSGFRHELISVFMLRTDAGRQLLIDLGVEPELHPLVLYLIAAHHGHIRITARDPRYDGVDGLSFLGCVDEEPINAVTLPGIELPESVVDLGIFRSGPDSAWLDMVNRLPPWSRAEATGSVVLCRPTGAAAVGVRESSTSVHSAGLEARTSSSWGQRRSQRESSLA